MRKRRNSDAYPTERDRAVILRSLDFGPLTPAQILKLSQTHPKPYPSLTKVHTRLRALKRLGLIQGATENRNRKRVRFCYHLDDLRGTSYWTLTWKGYRYLYGSKAKPTTTWHLNRLSESRERHTYCLMEFLVHTLVCAQKASIRLRHFARENSVQLKTAHDRHRFDAAFQLTVPGVLDFDFIVEIDNHSETLVSQDRTDTIERTLRFYESFRDSSVRRFKVLWITTGDTDRLHHIVQLGRKVGRNDRSLFLGISLPEFLRREDALTGPHCHDTHGNQVPLVWLPRHRFHLLSAIAEGRRTRGELLKASRRTRRLFTTDRSIDCQLKQLSAAGWIVRRDARTGSSFRSSILGERVLANPSDPVFSPRGIC